MKKAERGELRRVRSSGGGRSGLASLGDETEANAKKRACPLNRGLPA